MEHNDRYYLPLDMNEAGILEPAHVASFRDGDLPSVADLKRYIDKNYDAEMGIVDVSGNLFETQVFRPHSGSEHWYTIVDGHQVPLYRRNFTSSVETLDGLKLEDTLSVIEISEAISPQESISISDSFIEPDFEELDISGNAQHKISWSALSLMPRVVVIGSPGAGKTTTLRRLALNYRALWEDNYNNPFPIYVQMRHLHEGLGVEQAVRSNLLEKNSSTSESNKTLDFSTSKIVLILDGLDEIPQLTQGSSTDAITKFASKYKTVSIIASTREFGYDWRLPLFKHVRILPFNASKIREWSFYRFGKIGLGWLGFITSLEERKDLLEVAGNPLLLSLAVSLYRRNSILPQSKSSMMNACFDALVEQWDAVRGIVRQRNAWAAPARKMTALCHAAYNIRIMGVDTFSSADFASWNVNFIESDLLLEACERDTGIVSRAGNSPRWAFTHRIFSDYLAARFVVDHTSKADDLLDPLFKTGDWLDIWSFACGISIDATELLNLILSKRNLSKSQKLYALSAAFEQDMIASDEINKKSFRFIKRQIKSLINVHRENLLILNSEESWLSISVTEKDLHVDATALLHLISRIRKSLLGGTLRNWLLSKTDQFSRELSRIMTEPGTVRVEVSVSSAGLKRLHIHIIDENIRILEVQPGDHRVLTPVS